MSCTRTSKNSDQWNNETYCKFDIWRFVLNKIPIIRLTWAMVYWMAQFLKAYSLIDGNIWKSFNTIISIYRMFNCRTIPYIFHFPCPFTFWLWLNTYCTTYFSVCGPNIIVEVIGEWRDVRDREITRHSVITYRLQTATNMVWLLSQL